MTNLPKVESLRGTSTAVQAFLERNCGRFVQNKATMLRAAFVTFAAELGNGWVTWPNAQFEAGESFFGQGLLRSERGGWELKNDQHVAVSPNWGYWGSILRMCITM